MNQKSGPVSQERDGFRIDYDDRFASDRLANELYHLLNDTETIWDEIAIVCIGTDRSTGDALGPVTGSKLAASCIPSVHIFGTLDQPVHAVNLQETMDEIDKHHPSALVIAIDACLGELRSVGKITLAQGPLKPGAAVKKNLPEVGAFHLTAIVNIGGFMEYFVLQNTRLGIIMKMADVISQAVSSSVELYYKEEKDLEIL